MLNTKLIGELIERGDFFGVKEALEKSMAQGSQTFEQDIARLIAQGVVDRAEGLANADSPNNLLWRMDNEFKAGTAAGSAPPPSEPPSFGDITLDPQR